MTDTFSPIKNVRIVSVSTLGGYTSDGYIKAAYYPSTYGAAYYTAPWKGCSSTHAGAASSDGTTGGQWVGATTNSTMHNMLGTVTSGLTDGKEVILVPADVPISWYAMTVSVGTIPSTWGDVGIMRVFAGSTTVFHYQELSTDLIEYETETAYLPFSAGERWFPVLNSGSSAGTYSLYIQRMTGWY